jgi:hypothetical protein
MSRAADAAGVKISHAHSSNAVAVGFRSITRLLVMSSPHLVLRTAVQKDIERERSTHELCHVAT